MATLTAPKIVNLRSKSDSNAAKYFSTDPPSLRNWSFTVFEKRKKKTPVHMCQSVANENAASSPFYDVDKNCQEQARSKKENVAQ